MLTVHLRITDSATRRPTPVRLRVTGADGSAYAPFGRLTAFACGTGEDVGGHLKLGRESFSIIDGSCEIRLPTGVPLRIQAMKGPEFTPLDREVTLGAGQMALRFEIARWADLGASGWVSGDARCHDLSPHAALLDAAAEDVMVVNLLTRPRSMLGSDGTTCETVANISAFSGQTPALGAEGRCVVVNTLNAHAALGQVALLNSHRPIYPLAFGSPEASDDWSLCDWCDQCHRKNGLTVWVDAFRSGLPGGEALIAALLGKIDALEFDAAPRSQSLLPWWYRLLNIGLTLPLVGASGKNSNRVPVGGVRTYAKLASDEPACYAAWIDAVRAGRTVVTSGPLLSFTVAESGPGETLETPNGTLPVRAKAECLTPFEKLEVVADGEVIASAAAVTVGSRFAAELTADFTPTHTGWLAARCIGAAGSVILPILPTFAHTSPVYLRLPRRSSRHNHSAVLLLQECVNKTREWAETQGQYEDAKWQRQQISQCEAAMKMLLTHAHD